MGKHKYSTSGVDMHLIGGVFCVAILTICIMQMVGITTHLHICRWVVITSPLHILTKSLFIICSVFFCNDLDKLFECGRRTYMMHLLLFFNLVLTVCNTNDVQYQNTYFVFVIFTADVKIRHQNK